MTKRFRTEKRCRRGHFIKSDADIYIRRKKKADGSIYEDRTCRVCEKQLAAMRVERTKTAPLDPDDDDPEAETRAARVELFKVGDRVLDVLSSYPHRNRGRVVAVDPEYGTVQVARDSGRGRISIATTCLAIVREPNR